ncbi:iron-containing redox enzyme family protein [Motilibacter aurantiacus]|uniref:iron-containing redox enzyme family protein n=1 Tax=Motilibacter aurantiacus TaxID=2714955 RepID=UPI001409DC07|nr:iron-containing redox enzyme family protein [Motilibacter aurantiacus]NHC47001.1 iron-containing redox enzyme family protein [Motilibacter aurantiacus]
MTTPTATAPSTAPALPAARGPLSSAVVRALHGEALPADLDVAGADPLGADLQLALYICYELHYRGFDGVDDDLEWDPALLGLRRRLEEAFLAALRALVPGGGDVAAEIEPLLVEHVDAPGVSRHLRRRGELWQFREYIALRSLYHLKEADPQAWVIPRLEGEAKAALVSVEHDEYGAGRGERMHARLFADMMLELGLTDRYGAYVGVAPAPVIAEVNFMSLCGLRRSLRGALVGQFAVVELTSSPGSDRLVRAAERLGCGPATVAFYAEHVEADAVHEQVVRHGIIAPLVAGDPEMATAVVFGMQAANLLDERLSAHVLASWERGRSALVGPLEDAA